MMNWAPTLCFMATCTFEAHFAPELLDLAFFKQYFQESELKSVNLKK